MKPVTPKDLEALHRWFEGLTKYNDSDAPNDRLYAEGQIYACREALADFETKFGSMSRGFQARSELSWWMKGYKAFREEYDTRHVEYNI